VKANALTSLMIYGWNWNQLQLHYCYHRSTKVEQSTKIHLGVEKRKRKIKNKKDSILGWEAAPFVFASIGSNSVDDSALSPFLPAIHQ
jgi:hypothetical protein